jgi:hypothetical protein
MKKLALALAFPIVLFALRAQACDMPQGLDPQANVACGTCPAHASAAHRGQVSFAGVVFGYGFCQADACDSPYELYRSSCAPAPAASWFTPNASYQDGEYQVTVRAQLNRPPTASAIDVALVSVGDQPSSSTFEVPAASAHFQVGQYISDPIAITLHKLATTTDKVAKLALGSASGPTTSVTILSSVRSLPNTYWITTAGGTSSAASPTIVSDPTQALTMTVNFSQMQSRVFPTAWKVSVGTFAPITGLLLAGQTSFDFSVGTDILAALPASPAQVAVTVAGSNALASGSAPGAIEAQALAPAAAPSTLYGIFTVGGSTGLYQWAGTVVGSVASGVYTQVATPLDASGLSGFAVFASGSNIALFGDSGLPGASGNDLPALYLSQTDGVSGGGAPISFMPVALPDANAEAASAGAYPGFDPGVDPASWDYGLSRVLGLSGATVLAQLYATDAFQNTLVDGIYVGSSGLISAVLLPAGCVGSDVNAGGVDHSTGIVMLNFQALTGDSCGGGWEYLAAESWHPMPVTVDNSGTIPASVTAYNNSWYGYFYGSIYPLSLSPIASVADPILYTTFPSASSFGVYGSDMLITRKFANPSLLQTADGYAYIPRPPGSASYGSWVLGL